MPNYDFRCAEGCLFEASYSMTQVPQHVACPACGQDARRLMSAPYLAATNSAAFRVIDSVARSAHEPPVVSSLPARVPGGTRLASQNPLHRKLPQP